MYFQRVLSAKSPGRAEIMSYAAAVGCIILAIPPVLIGAIAKSAGEMAKYCIAKFMQMVTQLQLFMV